MEKFDQKNPKFIQKKYFLIGKKWKILTIFGSFFLLFFNKFGNFLVINYELEQSSLQHANYDPVLKRACMPNGPQPHPRPETHPKPVETVRNRYNNSINSSIFTPEVNN